MAQTFTLKFDSRGFAEVLNSGPTRAMVSEAAARIAAAARPMAGDVPIEVRHHTTDRAAAAVSIADGRGLAMQAESGILTRAAGSIGAEVTSR